MHKCLNEGCNNQIDDQYRFCIACVQKMKKDNAETGAVNTSNNNQEIIKSIGAVNNNLYAIRTILEAILEKDKRKLVWDKENSKFVIEKIKRAKA